MMLAPTKAWLSVAKWMGPGAYTLGPSPFVGGEDLARIRNWKKFQHYNHRRPPWIKLYREILDDVEWHSLSGESAKGLISLWLIASEEDGELPDSKTLAFRLRVSENRVIALLSDCKHWVCDDASNVLADCKQDATPEKSREEKIRERVETETDAPSALVPVKVWLEFVAMRKSIRRPMTAKAVELINERLAEMKAEGEDPIEVLQQSIRNSWPDIYHVKGKANGTRQTESFGERQRRQSTEAIGGFGENIAAMVREVGRRLPDAKSDASPDDDLPRSSGRFESERTKSRLPGSDKGGGPVPKAGAHPQSVGGIAPRRIGPAQSTRIS